MSIESPGKAPGARGLFANKRLSIALLAVVVAATYGNSLHSGFVFDDHYLVVSRQGFFSDLRNIPSILTSPDNTGAEIGNSNPYYRPLGAMSYLLDHYLWGPRPFGYHLEAVLLHACVVSLFYLLLLAEFKDGALAFFAALLFAVYPVNAEAVDFISARNSLLCALFLISSLLFLRKRGFKWAGMSVISYFLALMSKEPAIVLPFFLLSYTLTTREKTHETGKAALAVFFMTTALYFVLRYMVIGAFTSRQGIVFSIDNLKLVSSSLFEEFRLMLYPFKLNAIYLTGTLPFTAPKALFSILGVLSLVLLAVVKRTPEPVRAGAQWILWGLLPVSNIVRIPSTPVAERYQYTFLFGFVAVLGYLLAVLNKKRAGSGVVAAMALVLVLGVRTFERNRVWRSDLGLYQSVLRSDPKNPIAYNNLGDVLEKQGSLDDAAKAFQAAVALQPGFARAHFNLGVVYRKLGRMEDAMREIQMAIGISPGYADAHENLGIIYLHEGRLRDAVREFETSGKLTPDSPDVHAWLGQAYAASGNPQGALHEFKMAFRLDPGFIEARINAGVISARLGNLEEAREEFLGVLRLDPANQTAARYLALISNPENIPKETDHGK